MKDGNTYRYMTKQCELRTGVLVSTRADVEHGKGRLDLAYFDNGDVTLTALCERPGLLFISPLAFVASEIYWGQLGSIYGWSATEYIKLDYPAQGDPVVEYGLAPLGSSRDPKWTDMYERAREVLLDFYKQPIIEALQVFEREFEVTPQRVQLPYSFRDIHPYRQIFGVPVVYSKDKPNLQAPDYGRLMDMSEILARYCEVHQDPISEQTETKEIL